MLLHFLCGKALLQRGTILSEMTDSYTYCLMKLYISIKFHKNIFTNLSYVETNTTCD